MEMALRLSRTIILHIPKTGSDWVRAACHAAVKTPVSEIGEWHSDLSQVRAMLDSQPGFHPIFATFIRHPLSWYRSAWAYWMQTERFPRCEDDPVVESDDFESFVTNCLRVAPDGYVSRLYKRYLGAGKASPFFVGRQESLMDDLVTLLTWAEEDFDEDILRSVPSCNVRGSHPTFRDPGYSPELKAALLRAESGIISEFYEL